MKFEGFDKVGDVMIISLLFVLGCLPIITIGASFVGMYHAIRRSRTERGYVIQSYWEGFRNNFKQATVLWLILLAMYGLLYEDLWLMSNWTSFLKALLTVGIIILAYFLTGTTLVVFQMVARFENSTLQTLKNALTLTAACPLRTLVSIVIFLIPVVLFLFLPNIWILVLALWVGLLYGASGYGAYMLFLPVMLKLPSSKKEK